MKINILLLLIFQFGILFAQDTSTITGTIQVTHDGIDRFPILSLYQNGKQILGTGIDFNGNYTLKDVPFGNYYLVLSDIGTRSFYYEFEVYKWEQNFSVVVPGACLVYNRKICPLGHKNKIIPIIYGNLTTREHRKIMRGKIKSGTTGYCDRWHCKIHDIDF